MWQKSLLWTALVAVACGLDPQPVLPARGNANEGPTPTVEEPGLPGGMTPGQPTMPPGSAAGGSSGAVDPEQRPDDSDTGEFAGAAGAGGASGSEAEPNSGGTGSEEPGEGGGSDE
jgi:hypothetical protein